MIVTLPGAKAQVEIVDEITWGAQEQIRAIVYENAKVQGNIKDKTTEAGSVELNLAFSSQAKYKALEVCIKKITTEDGKELAYSKAWMDNLSVSDGNILYDAVDKVTNPKE